jgi:hypothetical protein
MDKIIGLGTAGCRLAKQFSKYPQYTSYYIDSGQVGKNCYNLKEQPSHELYESNCPDLTEFFSEVSADDEILFILGCSGRVSGTSLRILKQLYNKNNNINLLLILNDDIVEYTGKIHQKITSGILQTYTRSGLLKRCYLVNNSLVESTLGNLPIIGYYDKLNDHIANIIYQIDKSENIDPVFSNLTSPRDNSRIYSVGLYDLQTDKETNYYSLDMVDSKHYYFHINRATLESDGQLLKKLRQNISAKSDEFTTASFAVYETNYDYNFCVVTSHSRKVQEGIDN